MTALFEHNPLSFALIYRRSKSSRFDFGMLRSSFPAMPFGHLSKFPYFEMPS